MGDRGDAAHYGKVQLGPHIGRLEFQVRQPAPAFHVVSRASRVMTLNSLDLSSKIFLRLHTYFNPGFRSLLHSVNLQGCTQEGFLYHSGCVCLFHQHCWLALAGKDNDLVNAKPAWQNIPLKLLVIFIGFINLTVWRQYWCHLYHIFHSSGGR